MILRPGEYFTIVRQLGDHTDSGTNYVRAIIRDARTDTLLETLELEDKGNRRFSMEWQVPADPNGLGFYISVLTEVFTDSGYSSKNDNYRDEMYTYLVDQRPSLGQVVGGGTDISYEKIRKIVEEVHDARPYPLPEKVDLGEILLGLSSLAGLMGAFVDETREYRTSSGKSLGEQFASSAKAMTDARDAIVKAIGDKKIPEPEKYDDSGVRAEIQTLSKVLGSDKLETLMRFAEIAPQLAEAFKGLDGNMKDFLMIMAKNGVKKPSQSRAEEIAGFSRRS